MKVSGMTNRISHAPSENLAGPDDGQRRSRSEGAQTVNPQAHPISLALPVPAPVHGHAGTPGEVASSLMWNSVFDSFAEKFHVVALDRLGQGRTGNPAELEGHGHDASAAHTLAFLKALGTGPFHLVGHDAGAFIATQLAFEHPDLVASVALVAANSLTPGSDRRSIVLSNPVLPLLSPASLRWHYERSSYSHLAVSDVWMAEAASVANLEKTSEAVRVMTDDERYLRQQVGQWNACRAALHRRIHAEGLPCPTLIVWGFDDPIAPFENARYLMELLAVRQRDTELRIFNAAGHFPHWEQPTAFSRAVTSFVAQAKALAASTRARQPAQVAG